MFEHGNGTIEFEWLAKALIPIVTLSSGNPGLDVFLAMALVGFVMLVWFQGRVRFAPQVVGSLVALMVAYVALPHHMHPAAFVDGRIPIVIWFLVFSGDGITFNGAHCIVWLC